MAKKIPTKLVRESVPLRMIEGNIAVLLEHRIDVGSISFTHDPESGAGVILMVTFDTPEQEAAAKALGFRTGRDFERED